ncbi:hypothetical protein GLP21_12630 [Photobacterium carnosum]|uniref:DNA topoisomerase type IA zn finger domain-containing protein n=1 Tax=Photobacterium carnosum TaxID=2023717 RepID=A0A2N4UWD0_9GAMM|nr:MULTISPECIES: topoisomerase DNA-binding C4 zinc finger domain-containing protein [Photobacterium]MCD9477236.1 hypothetical protein [Photobacterium phosphoreum]MCD9485961.1 hypothetical protein [Photobacterium iliopiscarium]MCD9508777.1 hypothetical protein [Photobacterium phosphoreum]MCD9539310.1 hypothetical protein [Photobacterium carnosum]MCD9543029.1 hypothetical protein [Photobacterium carnosum]
MDMTLLILFLVPLLIIGKLVQIKRDKGKRRVEEQAPNANSIPTNTNNPGSSVNVTIKSNLTSEPKTQISLSNNDICDRCGGALHPITIMNGELKGFTILMCEHIACKRNEIALSSAKNVKRQQLKSKKLKVKKKPVTNKQCPECGSGLSFKKGKRGKLSGATFWGCDNFPKCCYHSIITLPKNNDKDKSIPVTNKQCPECGSGLSFRRGKRGKLAHMDFWGCDNFPKCRHYEIAE